MIYFRNKKAKTIRVVEEISKDNFIVVKLIFNDNMKLIGRTVKFWKGSLELTTKSWKTKVFKPNPEVAEYLKDVFNFCVAEVYFTLGIDITRKAPHLMALHDMAVKFSSALCRLAVDNTGLLTSKTSITQKTMPAGNGVEEIKEGN